MQKFVNLIFSFFKTISVEPPIILCAIAINIYALTTDLGMYRVVCDKFFNSNGGTAINDHKYFECWNNSQSLGKGLGGNGSEWWHEAEIDMQQQTTSYFMISSVVMTIPSMIANIILGAYGDRRGRKGLLLMGYFGIVFFMIPIPIVFAYPKTIPLYTTYIISGLATLTGGYGIVMSSNAAYLTDTVRDPEMLTLRMSLLQICNTFGVVVGPLIAAALLTAFNYVTTMVFAIALSSVSLLLVVLMVKKIKPQHRVHATPMPLSIPIPDGTTMIQAEEILEENNMKSAKSADILIETQKSEPKTEVEKSEEEKIKGNCCREIVVVIKEVPHLLSEAFRTIFKKRDGHKRAYIFAAAAIMFVFNSMDATFNGAVFILYVQKEPFSWTPDEVSYFRSVANLIRLIGASGGIFLFKKILRMSDSSIVFLAMASMTGQGILIMLSSTSWMLYLAAGVGALACLSTPCLQALIAKIMAPNEIGKAYGAFSLTASLSYFFSSVAIGAVYHETVAFFPALVFLVCAAIIFSATVLSLWLHVDFHRATISKYLKNWCRCFRSEDVYQVQ